MKGDTCVLLGVKELRLLSSMYTLALRHPTLGTTPPTSTPFLGIVETRWCSANSTPTIPSGSPKQEMTGQQPEGRLSTGRSAVRKPRSPYPTPLPGRQGQPSSPDITLLSGNLLPDVAWSIFLYYFFLTYNIIHASITGKLIKKRGPPGCRRMGSWHSTPAAL